MQYEARRDEAPARNPSHDQRQEESTERLVDKDEGPLPRAEEEIRPGCRGDVLGWLYERARAASCGVAWGDEGCEDRQAGGEGGGEEGGEEAGEKTKTDAGVEQLVYKSDLACAHGIVDAYKHRVLQKDEDLLKGREECRGGKHG
eukprot:CAMPEP_0174758930 /NCGR_PEP_ID=MMETSP1094-20130205/108015_1 /TAXON_ID=156173 /ORGANISM="Chrysochromulina brevifilum, Strain UTEX LB 985" /LENGTH=144 /DNA_ID=CAMNT_0015964861 /DNA_START=557 /DNA_END=992 /DNA_ORIENTATION=-